jgi:hypothetical protein
MANAIYPKAKEQAWQAGINLASGSVKGVLVDLADYTYSGAHEFLSDVPLAGRVAISPAFTGKTFVNGLFDANDLTDALSTSFTAVSGDPCEALIVFIDTGTPATSRLVAFFDTGVTGLPVTPNGGSVEVTWNASGIAQL